MPLPDGFLDRLDNEDVDVVRSVFLNANGYWAKDLPDVIEVFVEFEDLVSYTLTRAQYDTLTRTQKTRIKNADSSSPLP